MTGPRRPNRRQVLLALGTATVSVGLAGCSGDGNDGAGEDGGGDGGDGSSEDGSAGSGDGSAGSGDGSDGQTTFTQPASIGDPMGSIHHNRIDEFVVLGAESYVADGHEFVPDGRFAVDIRIGNNGDRPADPDRYIFSLSLHDASGESMHSRTRKQAAVEEFPPGDSAIITLWDGGDDGVNPDAIDSYELYVDCSVASADGIYCP